MHRRGRGSGRRTGAALVALALAAALAGCGGAGQPPRAKNVLLIVADTFRADRLGCYGYDRDLSAAIDGLAERGTVYVDARAQSCWTIPSMISLMSGLYVTGPERYMPTYQPSLAQVMRAQGLATAAFVGNPVLVRDRGFEQGFDHFEGSPRDQVLMPELVDGFLAWHAEHAEEMAETGFFAWLHFMDTHSPSLESAWSRANEPRADVATALRERWAPLQAEAEALSGDHEIADFETAVEIMTREDHLYDGEVVDVDRGVARVLEHLGEDVLAETLVVFAADHGESRFEHEKYPDDRQLFLDNNPGPVEGARSLLRSGHRDFYQPVWHTPLIFCGPGFAAGERIDGLAANLDIYPTLCAALGAVAPPRLQGEVLLGGARPERGRVHGFGRESSALCDAEGLKLIDHPPSRFGHEDGAPRPVELFDLAADPAERHELSGERAGDVERLRGALAEWQRRYAREIRTDQTPEAAEVLRKLGYVEEADEGREPEPDGTESPVR